MERYQKALVLGYGRSGKAAERLLLSEGASVDVWTDQSGGEAELQQQIQQSDPHYDVCVVSPGFSVDHPCMRMVRESGVPVLPEFELGWSRFSGKTIAITGSNGKSTAVKWVHELLVESGLKAAIGGNFGIPVCEVLMEKPVLDWLVLEVSSFQLETTQQFRCDVGVLLNLFPNHLDRHGSMATYRKVKSRLFLHGSSADIGIVPAALLEDVRQGVPEFGGRWLTFGAESTADYYYSRGSVFADMREVFSVQDTLFGNPIFGACTAAAVAAIVGALGLSPSIAEVVAHTFIPLDHRMQLVDVVDGVQYINDSKATNFAALAAALQGCVAKNVHLIAGGIAKEHDYKFIKEILAERVSSIYLIGDASSAMNTAWSQVCLCRQCGTLNEAFAQAVKVAKEGDVVLLSPGCASFDQFRSFEERGNAFVRLVSGLCSGGEDG